MKPFKHFLSCILLLIACNSSPDHNQKKRADDNLVLVDSFQDPHDHDTMGQALARKQINDLFKGKGQHFTWDTLIKSTSTAIAIAEPLLFDIFGKKQILEERPYEVYLIDGYWYLSGTIPKDSKGGAFEMIFSAKDGKIIRLTHYK